MTYLDLAASQSPVIFHYATQWRQCPYLQEAHDAQIDEAAVVTSSGLYLLRDLVKLAACCCGNSNIFYSCISTTSHAVVCASKCDYTVDEHNIFMHKNAFYCFRHKNVHSKLKPQQIESCAETVACEKI